MHPALSLLLTLLLAISIAASPLEARSSRATLSFAKHVYTNGGTINLLQHDQIRAAALRELHAGIQSGKSDRRDGSASVSVTNQAVSYIASVGIGSPPTTYNLVVDTGSSNTWIGASTPYKPTDTSVNTGQPVANRYGSSSTSASFSGEEWSDTVILGSNLVIAYQSIGVASSSNGFNEGVDGILGVGPEDLTAGTLTDDPYAQIPTVTQNLFAQGTISEEVLSIFFEPTTTAGNINGELTFGGTDSTKYTGEITYTPITSTSPAAGFWGIDQSITYGGKTILSETAGIVDTGTTLILMASNAYSAYKFATGAVEDAATGLLKLTTSQYDKLQDLGFIVGSQTYTLIPNAQIWPRSLNSYIGGNSITIYSIVGNIGTPSGEGFDFINGQSFLERFYSVFDTGNQQVGFATTSFTNTVIN